MKSGGFHTVTPVHDPNIFVDQDGMYYIFGSHMTAASSSDLRYWNLFADGVSEENPLFDGLFGGSMEAFQYCGKFNHEYYAVWSPDVSYNTYLQKYVMYFCTSATYTKSTICMAVADHVKGPYKYVDTILYSGFDEKTVEETNLKEILGENADCSYYLKKNKTYNNLSWPNCLDPNTFHDRDGRFWLVYGSWSGGIFLIEIDEKSGYPIHPESDEKKHVDRYFGKKLLGGGHKSIEGPFILYDTVADYYYLFVSFGALEREGGYQIRLFRSKKPDGPYVDMNGKTFRRVNHHDPYGLKLLGNYIFPSMEYGYKSPGHNSAFEDQDGRQFIVYHQRFDVDTEMHEPRVHQLFRTKNGWYTVCPFATNGEMLVEKNYHGSEISGIYYLIEHGLDISSEMHKPIKVYFTDTGEIFKLKNQISESASLTKEEKPMGLYQIEDESKIIIHIGDITYDSVIAQLPDEAGNPTMCITGVGSNQSLWAVKYLL